MPFYFFLGAAMVFYLLCNIFYLLHDFYFILFYFILFRMYAGQIKSISQPMVLATLQKIQ